MPRSPESCRQASLWERQLPGQLQDALTEPAQGRIFPQGAIPHQAVAHCAVIRGQGGSPALGTSPGSPQCCSDGTFLTNYSKCDLSWGARLFPVDVPSAFIQRGLY